MRRVYPLVEGRARVVRGVLEPVALVPETIAKIIRIVTITRS